MKPLIFCIAVLVVAVVMTFSSRQSAARRAGEMTQQVITCSNQCQEARVKLTEQARVIGTLEGQAALWKQDGAALSNKLAEAQSRLTKAATAESAAHSRMTQFEKDHAAMKVEIEDHRIALQSLRSAHEQVQASLRETAEKLAAEQSEKAAILRDLKLTSVERTNLERRWNDVTLLRARLDRLEQMEKAKSREARAAARNASPLVKSKGARERTVANTSKQPVPAAASASGDFLVLQPDGSVIRTARPSEEK
ncbi:MAG: hypothetical protein AB1813_14085 [Verrucomicrobiota bacterium]